MNRVLTRTRQAALEAVADLHEEDAEEVLALAMSEVLFSYLRGGQCDWNLQYLTMLRSAVKHRKREIRRRIDEQIALAIEELVAQDETAKDLVRWRLKAVKMPCRGLLEAWVERRMDRPKMGCVRQFTWVLKDPPRSPPDQSPAAGRTRDLAK